MSRCRPPQKHYLTGAYDPRRQRLVYVEGPRKISWLFVSQLRALQTAYLTARRIHVILDNYVIHKSHIVQLALRHLSRIRLHFLPLYCSDANLIERQPFGLHANVTRNHPQRSMIQLMTAVRRYLHRRFYAFRGVCCGC